MAGKTREIKGRMKSVGNIQRITRTMQMIATARFQSMQKRATQAQAYTRAAAEVVTELADSLGVEQAKLSHPLLAPPPKPVGKEVLLVITSNRGLCGGYNANILRTAMGHIRGTSTDQQIEVVGKKGVGYFRFNGEGVDVVHSQIGDVPKYEEVQDLAERYIDQFMDGQYDAVRVCYMSFVSMSRQTPIVQQLLPMLSLVSEDDLAGQADAPDQERHSAAQGLRKAEDKSYSDKAGGNSGGTVFEFSPSPEELLPELLPMVVKQSLFQCFNEAVVSEQLARMVAMKAATDAAGRMKKDLSRQYNRARQAAITTELSEIISGAAALG